MEFIVEYENLLICLQQKNIFVTNLIDYTKQLEVKAQAETVDYEDVLEKRQGCMSRIDKCDSMISSMLLEVSSKEQEKLRQVLDAAVTETECEDVLIPILAEVQKYKSGLKRLKELNDGVMIKTKQRHEEVKKNLARLRVNSGQQNMFTVK